MINSLNKSALLALTASLMASVYAGGAFAQEKPRSLVPSFVQEQSDKASDAERAPQAPGVSAPTEQELFKAPEQSSSGALQIQTLGALHAASIDVSEDNSRALGGNIWQGVPGDLVYALLEKIEAPVHSPALISLYQRLLFNGSSIPDASVVGDKILKLRLQKLIDLGYFSAAGRYFDRLPANVFDDDIRALKARLMLLDGREEAACSDQTIASAQGVVGFWAKFDVYCRIINQEFNKAELGAALLEESGEEDLLFFSLVASLIGSPVDLSAVSQTAEPIHYALLKRRDAVFPPNLVASAAPSVKAALSAQLPRVKEGAIELLLNEVSYGRDVNIADVISLADQPVQTASSDATAKSEDSAEIPQVQAPYAALLKSISEHPLPEERAKGLMSLWTSAQEKGDFFAVTSLSLPILQDLPAGPYGQDFNRQAVKILLMNDRVDLSRQWERTARRAAIQGTADERLAARQDITRLDTLILLAGVDGIARWNGASFNNWLQQMASDPDVALKSAFLLTMMEVFGYSVSDADWDQLIILEQTHRQAKSNHSFENTLVTAATSRQKGKTVALSLLAMGSGNVSSVSLTTLRAVTSALMAVGLKEDARKIALEAAILLDL